MRMYRAALFLLSLSILGAAVANAAPRAQDPQDPQDQQVPQDQYPQGAPAAYQNFTPDQLDNLLAPIALYPDPLLAQVLLAATFPDQIDEATRFLRAGASPDAIDGQPWDVSVKSVAHYPTVLFMMDNRLDWTTSLGQAYVSQSTDVTASIQRLRAMAHNAGTLVSGPQIQVEQQGPYWAIWPVQPQLLYVPVYDPAFVYIGRPGFYGPFLTFGVGYPIGSWLIYDFRWGGPGIYYFGWGGGLPVWAVRSRPFIRINNVYVNNRYNTVVVNRTVVNRTVNVQNLNSYNAVHRNVVYANAGRTAGAAGVPAGHPVNNQVIQRNINTNDARIQDFRGRDTAGPQMRMDGQGRPATPVTATPNAPPRAEARPQVRPAAPPQAEARPQARPAAPPSSAFDVDRRTFDPGQSSQRGQASRGQMSQPAPAPPQRSSPPPASRPSGGGGRKP
ncbi:MAG TPA: DUF3300 domain-containing protein [Candidatus Acidoferrales bacterium]|nr:DUF3300 domain-containing protein [Candidatus Acidoferrales bacterium]